MRFLLEANITSITDSEVSVILVDLVELSISCVRLKVLQRFRRVFDPVSLILRRLQLRSPTIKRGIFRDMAEVKASLNSDSKHDGGVFGGR